jgi:CRISPR-associated protein Cas5d
MHVTSADEERTYVVSFETAGPFAMFARPDTGSSPVSYPVPTYSAAKGMFEAVARLASGRMSIAEILPERVEVCCDIRYERYVTNYGGPLRKPQQVKSGDNYQLIATVLMDVCYRVYGTVEPTPQSKNPPTDCHQLQSMFERRLRNGQSFYMPCLGWREFVPSYFGPLRGTTDVNVDINERVESLLQSVFDETGRVSPIFRTGADIREGTLLYRGATNAN